jgi:hypothetical protein
LPPTRNDGSSERGYISTAHGTKRRAVDGLTASTATLDHPDAHKPLIRPQLGTSARLLTPSRLTIPPGTGQHGPPGSSVSSHQRPLSAKEHIACVRSPPSAPFGSTSCAQAVRLRSDPLTPRQGR